MIQTGWRARRRRQTGPRLIRPRCRTCRCPQVATPPPRPRRRHDGGAGAVAPPVEALPASSLARPRLSTPTARPLLSAHSGRMCFLPAPSGRRPPLSAPRPCSPRTSSSAPGWTPRTRTSSPTFGRGSGTCAAAWCSRRRENPRRSSSLRSRPLRPPSQVEAVVGGGYRNLPSGPSMDGSRAMVNQRGAERMCREPP